MFEFVTLNLQMSGETDVSFAARPDDAILYGIDQALVLN